MLSGQSCSNLVNVLVTNLLNEYHSLQPELTNQRAEMSKTSSLLNAVSTAPSSCLCQRSLALPSCVCVCVLQDLRALLLVLSVSTPQHLDPALGPALQELLSKCRLCLQHRATLEMEAKERKAKGLNRHKHTYIIYYYYYYILNEIIQKQHMMVILFFMAQKCI